MVVALLISHPRRLHIAPCTDDVEQQPTRLCPSSPRSKNAVARVTRTNVPALFLVTDYPQFGLARKAKMEIVEVSRQKRVGMTFHRR